MFKYKDLFIFTVLYEPSAKAMATEGTTAHPPPTTAPPAAGSQLTLLEWAEKESLKILGGISVTAGILTGGFILGLQRQKAKARIDPEKEQRKMKKGTKLMATPALKTVAPSAAASITWWERALGVKSAAMLPGEAARSAFLGGTILATAGCSVLILAIAASMGVSSYGEFHDKMSKSVPRFRQNVINFFGIVPKAGPTPAQLEQERAELDLLDTMFDEAATDTTSSSS
ncbi:Aste57867_19010 [Aphanomyces stellatus]|uniref:Aste57867_19010 protein n=1 Tax=Aphanomyces stellatus TaxID=120398 RepID=A0A485LBU6_9STRA|nr:hypothetical protein As57867_018946 [Aphanomyces stellatus]VFT95735.1 Aste57867_19010 [Aphanomyces stellatus]